MSGGGGGVIIIGDDDLATEIKDHIELVADFRQARALRIIAAYQKNENSVSRDDQQFLLRCAEDIVDHS